MRRHLCSVYINPLWRDSSSSSIAVKTSLPIKKNLFTVNVSSRYILESACDMAIFLACLVKPKYMVNKDNAPFQEPLIRVFKIGLRKFYI